MNQIYFFNLIFIEDSNFFPIEFSIFYKFSTSYCVTIVIALPPLPALAVLPTR